MLVTGAFGNLGSSTVPLLLARGHRVRTLAHVNRPAELCARFSGAEIMEGDVRDRALMDRAVNEADVVMHLAYVIPPRAWEELGRQHPAVFRQCHSTARVGRTGARRAHERRRHRDAARRGAGSADATPLSLRVDA
jgi:putative NADH-flavin reductase